MTARTILFALGVVLVIAACSAVAIKTPPSDKPSVERLSEAELQKLIMSGKLRLECRQDCPDRRALEGGIVLLSTEERWQALGQYIGAARVGDAQTYYYLALSVWKQDRGREAAAREYMGLSENAISAGGICTFCSPPDVADALGRLDVQMRNRCVKVSVIGLGSCCVQVSAIKQREWRCIDPAAATAY